MTHEAGARARLLRAPVEASSASLGQYAGGEREAGGPLVSAPVLRRLVLIRGRLGDAEGWQQLAHPVRVALALRAALALAAIVGCRGLSR